MTNWIAMSPNLKAAASSLLILLLASPCLGDTHVAESCSDTHVAAAISAASDGDTVTVPSGECTWATGVAIPNTKGIVLQGAGIGSTVITDNVNGNLLTINPTSSNAVTRVTGFTFDAAGFAKSSSTTGEVAVIGGAAALNKFRIDHNAMLNLRYRGVLVYLSGDDCSGVIDHNTFTKTESSYSVQSISMFGEVSQEHEPFSRPLSFGANTSTYIEDNTFTYNGTTDGALDAYGGARYVFRFNTVVGTVVGHHGADTGGYRGIAHWEMYGNDFTEAPSSIANAGNFRSGTARIFDNEWHGTYNSNMLLGQIYRYATYYQIWGQCNGNSAWDTNIAGGSGYMCLDQPGSFFGYTTPQGGAELGGGITALSESGTTVTVTTASAHGKTTGDWVTIPYSSGWAPDYRYAGVWQLTGGSGSTFTYEHTVSGLASASGTLGPVYGPSESASDVSVPIYTWSNRNDAFVVGVQPDGGVDSYFVANRDYYNEDVAFDGTAGVGVGAIASRPATCTAGVGYWATDEGEWNEKQAGADGCLYKCTATDTWTLYYTPYTYPHPLQGYVPPASRIGGSVRIRGKARVK